MKRLLLFVCSLIFLSSCYIGQPISELPSDNNRTYKVVYLFEHEGCKVYRFYDLGKYVYFTNCNNSTTIAKSDSTKSEINVIDITGRNR